MPLTNLLLVNQMGEKSFIAKLEEKMLMSTKPGYMDSKEKIDDFLDEKSKS